MTAALPAADRGVAGSLAVLTRMLGTVAAASLVLILFESLQLKHGFFGATHQTFQLAAVLAFVGCSNGLGHRSAGGNVLRLLAIRLDPARCVLKASKAWGILGAVLPASMSLSFGKLAPPL